MSFTVYHGGTDISSYVINYQRTKRICTGIGECLLTLSKSYSSTINPYNEIIVYENGSKRGTYFVADVSQNLPDYNIVIKAQDVTKQLVDYFISDIYEITTLTTCKYWIEKFLIEAGISYHFIADEVGHYMSLNTWVGNENVYDLLQRLCMENGWYFLADEDNELVIGKLLVDYDAVVQTVRDTEITNLTYNKDDKMLRNRVIVRGNADFFTQIWVTGEVKVITPWNYDSNDYRTAVIMSPDVPDIGIANQLANQVLNETRKITEVKAVEINDFITAECGNTLYVDSEFWSGTGLITTFSTKVNDKDGAKTIAILDERCPRLFGYYAGTGDVYVGTEGDGVWRKPLKFVHDWEDYSQGLQDFNVTDLSVANGVKSCVANGNLYIRTPLTTAWVKQSPIITISGMPSLDPYCMDSVVTKDNSTIEAIYADVITVSGENRSFLAISPPSGIFTVIPITVSGVENIYAYGMDHDGKDTYISEMEFITVNGKGTGWNTFVDIPLEWSYRSYAGETHGWGEAREDSLRLVSSDVVGYQKPDNYLDYKTTWLDNQYAFTYTGGFPYINDLRGQWIANAVGYRLHADSTFKIKVQKYRNNSNPFFFDFWYDYQSSQFSHNFYINFSDNTMWPDGIGTFLTNQAIIWANRDNTDVVGEQEFEFAFDPSMAGGIIATFTWNSTSGFVSGHGSYVANTVSNEITEITFTNVDVVPEYYYTNQGKEFGIPTTVFHLLKYDGNTFERKLQLVDYQKVEISQQSPIILFGGSEQFNNGNIDIWFQKEFDLSTIFASGYVSDARGATLLTASGLSPVGFFAIHPASGVQSSELYYTDFSNTLTSGYTYGGWYIVNGHLFYTDEQHQYTLGSYHTFSGILNKIETSNYSYDEPYILAGVTISGESYFYQKDGRMFDEPQTEFIARNNYLPDSRITTIRLDDRV